jgi:hypothetical protein
MSESRLVANNVLERTGRALDAGGRGRVVLAATAVGAAILLLVCTSMQSRARDAEEARAQKRAVRAVRTQIVPELSTRDVGRRLDGRVLRDLRARVDAEILSDPAVAGVRIWTRDGTPLFSLPAQPLAPPGDGVRRRIRDAVAGTTTSEDTAEAIPSRRADGVLSETLVLRTFTPLQLPGARPRAAAEVLTLTAAIDEASAQPWQMLRIALGVVLLAAVLLLLVAVHWAADEPDDAQRNGSTA